MALSKPKQFHQQQELKRRDSAALAQERATELRKVVQQKGYQYTKDVARQIAQAYRQQPGRTPEEDAEFKNGCIILWAFNQLFTMIEAQAGEVKETTRELVNQYADDGW